MREVVSPFTKSKPPRAPDAPLRWVDPAQKKRIRLSRALLLFTFLFAGITPSSSAKNTWKLIKQFDKPIGCAYFFDADHGLIGSGVRPYSGYNRYIGAVLVDQGENVSIYRTTDGGNTWMESAVPAHFPGAITQICMMDSMNGYASVFSDIEFDFTHTFGASSIWQTTDGGSTWFDHLHLDHVATSVYAQSGLLVFTKWDLVDQSLYISPIDRFGGACSYDSGATWTPNFRWCNDVAFSDSMNGVVTEMNQQAPGNNFWVTMDAGRTWQPSFSNQYEAWSVYAVPGKRIYFCSNESQPYYGLPYTNINWSTDGGFTWSVRDSFPVMHFTGTIAGAGNTLYFQTDSTDYGDSYQTGLYRSDDLGANWHWIGGPSNSRDTRFAVTGCEGQVVYAFDGVGGAWKTTDGGDGTLSASMGLSSDTILWVPNPCGDTLHFDAYCSSCIPITIDSARIVYGTELLPLPDLGIWPAALMQNDSAQISLLYVPSVGGESLSLVRVYAHSGENVFWRDITIRIENSASNTLMLSGDTSNLSVMSCGTAADSIEIVNRGCLGLVIDSVILSSSEVTVADSLPSLISDSLPYPLRFLYRPDSAENQTVLAHIYAHQGKRSYDTVVIIHTQSTVAPPSFALDSTTLAFETRFCQSQNARLRFQAISCDSITIDSITSSNFGFVPSSTLSEIAPRLWDSLNVSYVPDSAGPTSGMIRIYAHDGLKRFDTTIAVSGINYAVPQSVTLSTGRLSLATIGCQPIMDTLLLSDQGCDTLYLDSVITNGDSEISVSFDSASLPLYSNDSLPLHIIYSPQDGLSKTNAVRLLLHTSSRRIDTTIALSTSNSIPSDPLAISSDSLYLFTKYCQPVSMPFEISNLGCEDMSIDSVIILGDTLSEFSKRDSTQLIAAGGRNTTTVTFAPAGEGTWSARMEVFLHMGSKAIDTTLSIFGKNLTAPTPYIPQLPSLAAGSMLSIPIMLEPTLDTFSIHSYAFHLSFNTNLLTPVGLEFTNTCSQRERSYTFDPEPGSGCSGRIFLHDTISDTSQLSLPLVSVLAKVCLTLDTMTAVTLDSFVTDREPAFEWCSLPEQPFYLSQVCGDPLLLDLLNARTLNFNVISITPNPAASGSWDLDYAVYGASPALRLDLYDATGSPVYHSEALGSAVGEHTARIPVPSAGGDYFIVLGNGKEQTARSVSVIR